LNHIVTKLFARTCPERGRRIRTANLWSCVALLLHWLEAFPLLDSNSKKAL
jgi:hypothetical protein